jgi:hypothetical protein
MSVVSASGGKPEMVLAVSSSRPAFTELGVPCSLGGKLAMSSPACPHMDIMLNDVCYH